MLDRATAFFTGAVKKAVPPPARSSPMPAPGTVAQAPSSGDPVVDLLGRQLASGLWDEPGLTGDEEVRTVRATARALLELLRVGVTTAHPLHGAQVRKAVQALAERAARIAGRAPQLAEFALGVAWLIASGRRTRGEVEAAVAREAALAALRARFADEQALRAHVDQAAATV
jgi:Ca-activated chloride channel family protein